MASNLPVVSLSLSKWKPMFTEKGLVKGACHMGFTDEGTANAPINVIPHPPGNSRDYTLF